MPPLSVVTGATGFLGAHLVGHLAAGGGRVRAVGRDFSRAAVPAGVEARVADVTDRSAVAAALEGADVVYHLAALLHMGRPPPGGDAAYRAVNVGGTRHVLAAAPGARVVLASSIAVYGPGGGGPPFTEASRRRPASPYATSKVAAEDLAGDHPDAVVVRLAAVYGPGMRGNYLRMLRAVARGRFVLVGDASNRRTLVHAADACRALHAAAVDGAAGSTFNATDGAVHTVAAIAAAMAAASGRRPPRLRVPEAPVRLAVAAGARLAHWAGRRPPIGPEAVAKLTEDMAVDGDALRGATRYEPEVGLRAGWASVAAGSAGRAG